jgi:hypothetical protein
VSPLRAQREDDCHQSDLQRGSSARRWAGPTIAGSPHIAEYECCMAKRSFAAVRIFAMPAARLVVLLQVIVVNQER